MKSEIFFGDDYNPESITEIFTVDNISECDDTNDMKIDKEKYGEIKPFRVIKKAKIIDDSN